jgi:transcriptional regulator with XRE-family HTH domain
VSHTSKELSFAMELLPIRVRMLRRYRRESQHELAQVLQIHRPSVTLIEKGRQHLTAEQLILIADHYGVRLDWLCGMDLFSEGNPFGVPPCVSHGEYTCEGELEEQERVKAAYRSFLKAASQRSKSKK